MTNANRIKVYAPRRARKSVDKKQGVSLAKYGRKQCLKRVVYSEVTA